MRKILMAAVILCTVISLAGCSDENTYSYTEYDLERNGVQLHLDCMTADNVEAEDNILLVHGLTYSSHEFDVDCKDYSLVRFLCDNGYAVWRVDIAGYGQSEVIEDGFEADSEYASEDIGAAIEKIVSVTGAEDIDMLGWSWGTVTSALAEEKYSSHIDKYVMYAPILSGLGEADITEDYHVNTWENAAGDFQLNEEGEIDYSITESEVVNAYCSNCWRFDGESSPNGGRKDLCVDESVKLIDLSKIDDTTLVICGDNDPYMNMELVEESLDSLPEGSELKIIEGASHCAMIEKPYYEEFRETLIGFLR